MFTGKADDELLPIYVVYKSDHLWDMWLEGGPEGTIGQRVGGLIQSVFKTGLIPL